MAEPVTRGKRPPKWLLLLQELRAPFFTASLVPVLLGTALAFYHTGRCDIPLFLLTLAAMVLIHAGANVSNDYFDHVTGNDEANVDFVRPFTGGSRMIQKGLLLPREVLTLGLACFAAGSATGLYLVARAGPVILVLGIIGVLGGFLYSAPPVSLVSRGIGEIVIGINFGVLPVVGSYFVQTGRIRWEAVLVSIPVAVLISAILFINQFQDFEADKQVGKRNWVVRLGRRKATILFAVMMVIWVVPIIVGVLTGAVSSLCLIGLLPLIPAIKAVMTARQHYDHPQELAPANALTVVSHLVIGLLLAVSLTVAGCGKHEDTGSSGSGGLGPIAQIVLPVPAEARDATYLGLAEGKSEFSPADVKARILVIQLFDMYCMLCQEQAGEVNRLYGLVQASDIKDHVRFLGIGKKNTQTEADIYRDRYEVPFPMLPDPQKANTLLLGEERTPSFTIVDLEQKKIVHRQWKLTSADDFMAKLKAAAGNG